MRFKHLHDDARRRTRPSCATTSRRLLSVVVAGLAAATLPLAPRPALAAAGGPLVLMGIDAEDCGPNGHGPIANYVQITNSILSNVTNGGSGILVIGGGGSCITSFWNAIASSTGKPVAYVNGANISTKSFAGFAMLAVVSDWNNTSGGMTPDENNRLGARKADVAAFVNGGGGLLGFTSDWFGSSTPYAYLGAIGSFTFNTGLGYSNITPTPDGTAIGVTNAFDVCCWHDEYLAFPSFLKVLATNASNGRAAAVGGVNVVISDIQLAPPSQSGPVGSSQTVTATVKENNAPVAGRTVTFTAVSGPNAGVLGTAVTDSNGQASLTYSSAVAGTDTVEASFVDSTAKTQTSNRVLVEWEQTNRPPIVSAGGPYSGDEGAPVTLTGTASDPDGDPLTLTWTYTPVSGVDSGATCTFSAPNALTTTITCTDDGLYHVKLTATDAQSSASDSVAVAMLANVAPVISSVNVPVNPVALGNPVTATAPFTDQGANDTHTWVVNWDDAATSPGSGAVSASHTYASPGIYLVSVTVTDDDGGSDTETAAAYIVIYDPNAGFVTGGGWIDSPAGAYTADPTLAGKANFGFVSKYKKGASVPDGNTEFQFHAGNLNFSSTSYEWLVVSGPKAQFKGSGTINGAGNYAFLLTANDGQLTGGGGVDRFRIKIWDKTANTVVYDNQMGAADSASASDAIEGGSIVIHVSNK